MPQASRSQRRNLEKPLSRGNACHVCRAKKLKCDGVKPVCGGCKRVNRHQRCEWDGPPQWGKLRRDEWEKATLSQKVAQLTQDVLYLTGILNGMGIEASGARIYTPPYTPPPSFNEDSHNSDESASIQLYPVDRLPETRPGPVGSSSSSQASPGLDSLGLVDISGSSSQGGLSCQPSRSPSPLEGHGNQPIQAGQQPAWNSPLGLKEREILLKRFFSHSSKFCFHIPEEIMHQRLRDAHGVTEDVLMDAVYSLATQTFPLGDARRTDTRYRLRVQFLLNQAVNSGYTSTFDRMTAATLLSQGFFLDACLYEARHWIGVACDIAQSIQLQPPSERPLAITTNDMMALHATFTVDCLLAAYTGEDCYFPPTLAENLGVLPESYRNSPKSLQRLDAVRISVLRAKAAHFLLSARKVNFRSNNVPALFANIKGFFEDELPGVHCVPSRSLSGGDLDLQIWSIHVQVFGAILLVYKALDPRIVGHECEEYTSRAGDVVALVRELSDMDYEHLDAISAFGLRIAAEQYLAEARGTRSSSEQGRMLEEVEKLRDALQQMSIWNPLASAEHAVVNLRLSIQV
ncbi:hypothetical protein M422DRAFT_40563 [Sphaerobolus stellatus SS14]|nr:hypothetical protein M422DRAFT_40563 [Sphaerobolus stellatus SS14]